MKKFFLVLLSISSLLFAQNKWNLTWKLGPMPFQDKTAGSEMAIVKAGFDTDQDGWGEFICAYTDLDSNFITMYEASADNTYDLVWYWKYPVRSNSFAGIAVGDMDNDGVVEIITTLPTDIGQGDPNPPRLWVFEWNGVVGENKYGKYSEGSDTPEPTSVWNYGIPDNTDYRPYSLTVEDIDNDGTNELITGVRKSDRGREVNVASVSGQFGLFASWQTEYDLNGLSGGSLYSTTTGDLDKDGNKEIYAMIWNKFTLKILENQGDGNFVMASELDQIYDAQGIDYGALDGIRVADVNGDGVNELYIAGTEPENTVFIISNISDVSTITADDVKELIHLPRKGEGKLRAMYIADPDHDGKTDLMIAGERNGRIYDLEYNGSGDPADSTNWTVNVAFDIWDYSGFSPDSSVTLTPRLFYGCPAGDMDKDGKDEYVFVNYSSDFNMWDDDGTVWVIEAENQASAVEDNGIKPSSFSLSQNYPNPFSKGISGNATTTINYNLAKASNVSLKVYNSLGQVVATLVNTNKPAGRFSATFNAKDLPSGIYFYRLRAGNFVQTRKMILVK